MDSQVRYSGNSELLLVLVDIAANYRSGAHSFFGLAIRKPRSANILFFGGGSNILLVKDLVLHRRPELEPPPGKTPPLDLRSPR